MFGKVIGKVKNSHVSQVEIGVLFEVVDSPIPEQKGLICVKTFNNFVCIVGNDSFKSFHSTWGIKDPPRWIIKILLTEQVILSNKEF